MADEIVHDEDLEIAARKKFEGRVKELVELVAEPALLNPSASRVTDTLRSIQHSIGDLCQVRDLKRRLSK